MKESTNTPNASDLAEDIHDAALDLIEAVLELGRAQVAGDATQEGRIDTARRFLHDAMCGDHRGPVPQADLLFTANVLLDALGQHFGGLVLGLDNVLPALLRNLADGMSWRTTPVRPTHPRPRRHYAACCCACCAGCVPMPMPSACC